ncbi:hypothetical protein A2886_00505 [candidate division WWE3 bacterium RIFCSPHIGHO2_01_FULL_42_13]|uniref:Uncharacterized protein n=1 Tax=candidate division WWE3 bacterium RIFCSPHIGHO2_01_FULL_42_13 TaxID=1802617 RepID=A0A1F4US73_UNCKA|nr:MAG: hypothetical protein A2886_00505 [candidate division WWE3 bacterium RIFCSPHIGHO2_01_FULL_42_13]
MRSLKDILKIKSLSSDKRNTYEFQAYGNRLAQELRDEKHRSLYIKLAKTEDRNLLEQARDFVVSQTHAETPGKLFMWRLGQLRDELRKKPK